MKTCRHCLSDDIPDKATQCRHCGRRLKPIDRSNVFAAIMVTIVGLGALWIVISLLADAIQHQRALDQAHQIIEEVKYWCSPQTSEEEAETFTRQTQAQLEKLHLDEEGSIMDAALENRLNQLGCGFSARNQPKPARPRRHH